MHDYAHLLYSDKGISIDKDSTVNYFKLFDEENSDEMIYHAFMLLQQHPYISEFLSMKETCN